MKSGLEGRNNEDYPVLLLPVAVVSMKSGLEGRNNHGIALHLNNRKMSQ